MFLPLLKKILVFIGIVLIIVIFVAGCAALWINYNTSRKIMYTSEQNPAPHATHNSAQTSSSTTKASSTPISTSQSGVIISSTTVKISN